MARKPKPRVSYRSDAQYLLRLAHAVERDESRSPDWRRQAVERINQLAYSFLEITGGQKTKETEAPENIEIIPEDREPETD